MAVNPIPEGFRTVTPHMTVSGAAEAVAFYEKAFGAETMMCLPGPGGAIMHAEIRIGDSVIMLADEFPGNNILSPKTVGGTTIAIALYVEDCDAAFQRAVDAGCTADMPPMDMFWGDRYSKVSDPWGHCWEISTHTEDLEPEEIGKRAEEWFKNFDGNC